MGVLRRAGNKPQRGGGRRETQRTGKIIRTLRLGVALTHAPAVKCVFPFGIVTIILIVRISLYR